MDKNASSSKNLGAVRASAVSARTRPRKQRLLHAAKQFLGMFLYLWSILGLFLVHESVVLARYHITFARWGFAFVTALVLAKVMLVMEELDFPRRPKVRPLVYAIVLKAGVFAVVFVIFYVIEEMVGGLLRGETLLESIPSIGGGTPEGMLLVWLIVSIALIPYFAFRELGRALGEDDLRALLFSRDPKPARAPE